MLQTVAFDLTVEHPYKYLLTYVKGIKGNRNLAQVAWNFVNDRYELYFNFNFINYFKIVYALLYVCNLSHN